MQVIYSPDGESPRRWPWEPHGLDWQAAAVIESIGAGAWSTYGEYVDQLMGGGVRAAAVTVWHLLSSTTDPGLRLADLRMRAGDVVVTYDDEELSMIREAMLADPDLTPAGRAEIEREMGVPVTPFGGGDDVSPPSLPDLSVPAGPDGAAASPQS